jgi:hypothetical protein
MCVCFWGSFYGYGLNKINFKKIRLVGFKYEFGKKYGWSLCIAKNMYKIFGCCIWECGYGYFSKCFLLINALK